jgi:hypothetical protein
MMIIIFFPHRAAAPSGLGSPNWDFTITLRHIILGRTPLDEWSARRRDLTIHKTPRRDPNPQSQQASGRRPTPSTAQPLGSAIIIIIIIIKYCNDNFNGKCRATVGPKLSGPPGNPDCRGTNVHRTFYSLVVLSPLCFWAIKNYDKSNQNTPIYCIIFK